VQSLAQKLTAKHAKSAKKKKMKEERKLMLVVE